MTVACGLALAAATAMADPISPNTPIANFVNTTPNTNGVTDIYLAGSSAIDLALTKFIAVNCDANTLDSYRTDTGGKTYYLWTCTTSASSGFNPTSGNTKFAIHKNTNSSSDGTNAVAAQTSLQYLQASDLIGATNCAVAATPVPATANMRDQARTPSKRRDGRL